MKASDALITAHVEWKAAMAMFIISWCHMWHCDRDDCIGQFTANLRLNIRTHKVGSLKTLTWIIFDILSLYHCDMLQAMIITVSDMLVTLIFLLSSFSYTCSLYCTNIFTNTLGHKSCDCTPLISTHYVGMEVYTSMVS